MLGKGVSKKSGEKLRKRGGGGIEIRQQLARNKAGAIHEMKRLLKGILRGRKMNGGKGPKRGKMRMR